MSQSHFTLSFPLQAPADTKGLTDQLPIDAAMFRAAETIGTVHYSRFTVLSERTLLFLGDFDGEFSQLMTDLARLAGPVFDEIFQHVDGPPPTTQTLSSNGRRNISSVRCWSTPLTPM